VLFRKRAKHRPRRIRKLRLLVLLFVLLLLSAASFSVGLVTSIAGQLPDLDPARAQAGEVDGYIYADNGRTILAVLRGKEARVLVDWKDISPWMKHAIVDIEDKRFYEHRGVDVRGILRALWADIRHKSTVQGGSTITQQFVKNSLVHDERTISRKVKEAALAWQLESGPRHWSKTRILTAYLNTIYLGNGAYGVETASKAYFGHSAATLSLPEAALLAGIPADPSRWDPVTHPRDARARRRTVLVAMLEQGHITHRDFVRANKAPLPKPDDVRVPSGQNLKAPYFTNYVKQLLLEHYRRPSTVYGGGLRVRTSINMEVQQAARDAIAKWLDWPDAPTAALVALDPRDGRVLAMVGGRSYRESQFNLAVQGERQPGSSFKPFVLATALQAGIAPGTKLVSRQITLFFDGTYWPVHNYEGSYLGTIDLQQATIHSDNSVFAQLTRIVGPSNVVHTARRLGISSPLQPYLSIGLGAQAVNPLEMARAFSAFANGGSRIDGTLKDIRNRPRAILAVGDKKSTDLQCGSRHVECNNLRSAHVLREDTAATVNSILQRVVTQGTGRRAALLDRPAAGKTGTTENYGDAWFVGYTPQLVTAVWVGYPNKLVPMTTQFHGDPVAGGTYPAMIWKTFMQEALQLPAVPDGEEVKYFEEPPALYGPSANVVLRDGKLQLDNGRCRNTVSVEFFYDRVPARRADCRPNEVEVPSVVGDRVELALQRLVAQPLTPSYVYKPAKPGQRLGVVLAQYPSRGRLTSYDRVMLVVPRALHGVVPNVVGLDLRQARKRLNKKNLSPFVVRFAKGKPGRVLAQKPRAGVAAAAKLRISLVVGRSRTVAASG
jgi:penicillin-binding protein 1A